MRRRESEEALVNMVINSITAIREMHGVMGLKKMYHLLKPDAIGRDKFIEIGMEFGFGIKRILNYHRTTYSNKSAWFTNIASIAPIYDINMVWVSDITYFRVGDKFYYLTFIEDVYSRRILAYIAYPSLEAEANCLALRMALKERAGMSLKGLIHHSDRGTQYTSSKYLGILMENQISVSMCDTVYENTHIERVNGIIKNEYLQQKKINSLTTLQKELKQAVKLYNEERPHWSLQCKTPIEFEKDLVEKPIKEREKLKLYSENTISYEQEPLFEN
jgi:transposase InsO family protein